MRERRPTSTRSSPQAQAAPCSQAACRRPDPARRPLHSCTGTAGDRRKGAREKKKKKLLQPCCGRVPIFRFLCNLETRLYFPGIPLVYEMVCSQVIKELK